MKLKEILREVHLYILLPVFSVFFALTLFTPLLGGLSGFLLELSMYVLCGVLLLKSVIRLYGYHKALGNHARVQPRPAPENITRARRRYAVTALIMWLAALVFFIIFSRFTFLLIAASWALIILDIIFYTKICLFQKIGALINKKEHTACCHVCPIRGWGLMMLATPLLPVAFIFPVITVITLIFCLLTLIMWQTHVKKALLPDYIHRNCAECGHKCGEEYLDLRKCRR